MHAKSVRKVLLLTGVALALAAQPAVGQTPPSPLTGQTFIALELDSQTRGQVDVAFDCNPGGVGSATFEASGPTGAPYPGTFHETGRFEFERLNDIFPPYLTKSTGLEASFTIDSPTGDVIGKKRSGPVEPDVANSCGAPGTTGDPESGGTFQRAAPYDALIRTDQGTFRDEGTALAQASDGEFFVEQGEGFIEYFTSTATELVPFTKQDCKDSPLASELFASEQECRDFVKGKTKKKP